VSRPHPALVPLAAGRAPDAIPVTDDGLLRSAGDHGMQGLLWTWVRDHAPDYSARTTLVGYDMVARTRNARLTETLAQVQRTLDAAGITAATLKGVTAEARWYARPGERPSSDVDVIVDAAAAGGADEVLAALEPDHPLRHDLNALVRSGAVQSVDVRVGTTAVDVHFDLLKIGIPTRGHDLMWERAQDHILPDGTTVRVLDPETALVHFLVHLNRDAFPRLLGFADVARILQREDLDWEYIERFLRGEGLEGVGACSLAMVTQRLGLPPAPLTARGIRARAWRATWPERVTLLGSAGTARSRRHRPLGVATRVPAAADCRRPLRRRPRPVPLAPHPRAAPHRGRAERRVARSPHPERGDHLDCPDWRRTAADRARTPGDRAADAAPGGYRALVAPGAGGIDGVVDPQRHAGPGGTGRDPAPR